MTVINRRHFLASGAAAATLVKSRVSKAQAPLKIRIGLIPYISSGPAFVAIAKGLFARVGLDAEFRFFGDGALTIPSLVAGELDVCVAGCNAGLFNAVSKGADFKLVLDRCNESVGFGSTTIMVSNKLYESGVTGLDKFAMLKGARFSIVSPGGIDHFMLARGLQKAGIDPRGQSYASGLSYPDIVKSMGAGSTDAAQISVPLAYLAEQNGTGKKICWGYEIEPDIQLACWATPAAFAVKNREALVRFAMAHTHAARIYMVAAKTKDPEIMKILSEGTKVPVELVEKAAPNWGGFTADGAINKESVLFQASFWTDTMKLTTAAKPQESLFDATIAQEAVARLAANNPFI